MEAYPGATSSVRTRTTLDPLGVVLEAMDGRPGEAEAELGGVDSVLEVS